MSQHHDIDAFIDFTKESLGINDQRADQFALDLSRRFGGEYVYVTKGIIKNNRDKEIRSAYNGHNVAQLARQYGLSERHIYNIVM